MHSQKFLAVPALFLAAALPLSACSASGSQGPAADTSSSPVSAAGDLFTARDLDPSYDADAAVSIALCGTSAVCDSGAVELSGSTVTITSEGTYRLSGALEGMVIVDVPSADKVQLVLEDASIFSARLRRHIRAPGGQSVSHSGGRLSKHTGKRRGLYGY